MKCLKSNSAFCPTYSLPEKKYPTWPEDEPQFWKESNVLSSTPTGRRYRDANDWKDRQNTHRKDINSFKVQKISQIKLGEVPSHQLGVDDSKPSQLPKSRMTRKIFLPWPSGSSWKVTLQRRAISWKCWKRGSWWTFDHSHLGSRIVTAWWTKQTYPIIRSHNIE